MNKWIQTTLALLASLLTASASEFSDKIWSSYDAGDPVPTEIFKVRDGVELHYFAPASPRVGGKNPAFLYIHGGGWRGGNPTGTYRFSRYLAEHGVSAFTLKYRLSSEKKGTKPTICLEDAKSGMRWLRAHAVTLGIDADQIAVGGNSAGGHLSAALATIDGYNHPDDDLSVATTPNLLLLGSPVLDNGPGGYGNGWDVGLPNRTSVDYRVKEFWQDFSPLHNLNDALPDTLVIMGDSDPLIKMTSMQVFGQGVVDAGSEFEWWVFPKKGHGLNSQAKSYLTPELMHIHYSYFKFLAKKGYMDEPLPAGDEVRAMIREHKLGESVEVAVEPAVALKAHPGILREWTFDSDGDLEGWTGNPKTLPIVEVANGFLFARCELNGDPKIHNFSEEFLAPNGIKTVQWRVRETEPDGTVRPADASGFFVGLSGVTWKGESGPRFSAVEDGQGFYIVTVDYRGVTLPQPFTFSRLDPIGGADAQGNLFEIDWIRIYREPVAAQRLARKKPREGAPNLIVILADDMGIGDIGAFRQLYPDDPLADPNSGVAGMMPALGDKQFAHEFTPNLDRLANQGVRCTRAYSGSWCAPSRQMLLSGQWSSRRSAYDHPWFGNQLRELGYVTGFVGKSHGTKPTAKVYGNTNPHSAEFDDGLFFNSGARGFYMKAGETFPGRVGLKPFEFTAKENDYVTDVFTDHAVDFIERHADRPFMLYLPYTAPHEPLHGKPKDLKELFPDVFAGRADAAIIDEVSGSKYRQISSDMKAYHYAAMVYNMDKGIGRIMDTLKQRGIADNTLVIFTCDNGAQWGCNYPGSGHKVDTMDGGIRVPFIVWSAGIEQSSASGSVYNGLVSLAYIAPTLVGEAGAAEYPYPSDGTNMMPYWLGEKAPLEGRSFFWSNIGWGQSLTHKLTGGAEFSDEPLTGRKMSQAVYIKDDQKVTSWHLYDSDNTGAVYARLPDVAGQANPALMVAERSPVAGQFPVEGPGRALLDEMIDLVIESNRDLAPDWTGAPDLDDHSWWMMDE